MGISKQSIIVFIRLKYNTLLYSGYANKIIHMIILSVVVECTMRLNKKNRIR